MQTEIAGLKITYKDADDLNEKAVKALGDVRKYLQEVEKERLNLKAQKRLLQKFLGIESAAGQQKT